MKSQIKKKEQTNKFVKLSTNTDIMNFHGGQTFLSKKCMWWLL